MPNTSNNPFSFTDEDYNNIKDAINDGGKIWENPKLNDVKSKIKKYFRKINNEQCCYCRKDTTDEFNMVLDIEHVLPKSNYRKFMFTPFNLNVSCKRCNMKIKGERTDFIVDIDNIESNANNSSQYHFSHPNLDNYFLNIEYHVEIYNNKKLIKYKCLTPKGFYTYDFFKLRQMEVNSLNKAQGIAVENNELSDKISTQNQEEIESLLANI